MHIVLLPLPFQGHLNPFLLLARLLSLQGFTLTVAVTEELATKMEASAVAEASNIRHATMSLGSEPFWKGEFDLGKAVKVVEILRPAFEDLLGRLASSPPGVSCIIFDCFAVWGMQVASKLNIPAFCFYTANAHTFAVALHSPTLISGGLTDPNKMIDDIPGLIPLQVRDLPQSILYHPLFAQLLIKDVPKTAGVILNTVLELEKEPVEAIRNKVPCYTIGPMIGMLGMETLAGVQKVDLWTEQRECLSWLDTRSDASVLFVSFGSLATLSSDQMQELADGLEASGQAFLWVVRSNSTPTNWSFKGFQERTKDRGLIISWAPQLEVLSHVAVGGFITHCGWNSVVENLSLKAIPMICWPQIAEQRLNKRLIVDKWKIGLELREVDGIVKSTEVEKLAREVIQVELRRKLGKRALQLRETILSAIQEGGSSRCNLKALGQDIQQVVSR